MQALIAKDYTEITDGMAYLLSSLNDRRGKELNHYTRP